MAKRKIFKIIKDYIALIESKGYDVSEVYLFGSYAKNKAHTESDIDIAVIMNNVDDYFDTQIELMKLRRKINLYIEPHPISKDDFKTHSLYQEITKHGLKVI
jgi:uncharacterized protein